MKAPSLDKSISLKMAGIAFVAIYVGTVLMLAALGAAACAVNSAAWHQWLIGQTWQHIAGYALVLLIISVVFAVGLAYDNAAPKSEANNASPPLPPALRLKPPLSGTTGPLGCSLEPSSILTSLPNQPTANPPARQNACHSPQPAHEGAGKQAPPTFPYNGGVGRLGFGLAHWTKPTAAEPVLPFGLGFRYLPTPALCCPGVHAEAHGEAHGKDDEVSPCALGWTAASIADRVSPHTRG